MLGWSVAVFKKGDEGSSWSENLYLARWGTGLLGLNWLDELVKENKAVDLGGDGYPYSYSVTAGILLPILKSGLPKHNTPPVIGDDYTLPEGWSSGVVLYEDKFLDCTVDQVLIVEAWDLS
ncbi:MAG: hypothetical protein PHV17_06845 [Candidatus Omnitrophica bacterium]|nr:hypothetical protein [Candidatus Omnitrophota bacterium]